MFWKLNERNNLGFAGGDGPKCWRGALGARPGGLCLRCHGGGVGDNSQSGPSALPGWGAKFWASYERGTPVGKWQGFSLGRARFIGEWQCASISGSRFLANPCRQISQANSCTQLSPANPYQRFLRADRSSRSLRADRHREFLTPRTKEFPRTTASSAPANSCQQLSPENSCPLTFRKRLHTLM